MKNTLRAPLFALAAGLLFALGLVVSGMAQPAKVIGFLNIGGLAQGVSWTAQAGLWDPSLAFVMSGALMITLLAFALTPRAGKKPWAAEAFALPTRQDIDKKLIAGGVLFGIGWALAGYCPGPALTSMLTGGSDAVTFVVAMLVGMVVAKKVVKS
jgi:uncharacterized membrane protein YedE/YeeE